MNYSLFLKILLLLVIIATISICALKPKMHTNVLVFDSSYKIVEHNIDTTVEKDIPTVSQKQEEEKTQKKVETVTQEQNKNQTPKQTTVNSSLSFSNQPLSFFNLYFLPISIIVCSFQAIPFITLLVQNINYICLKRIISTQN